MRTRTSPGPGSGVSTSVTSSASESPPPVYMAASMAPALPGSVLPANDTSSTSPVQRAEGAVHGAAVPTASRPATHLLRPRRG